MYGRFAGWKKSGRNNEVTVLPVVGRKAGSTVKFDAV